MNVTLNLTQHSVSLLESQFTCSGKATVAHDDHTHTFKFKDIKGGFFHKISPKKTSEQQIVYFLQNISHLNEITPNKERLGCCFQAQGEFKSALEDHFEELHYQ